jgi:Zn-dependent peptidase ImmA (M78 family)
MFTQTEELGRITIDRVLIEYDGPKFFTAHNERGQHFAAIFIDDDDEFESFLYTPVDPERVKAFLSGIVTGKEILSASSEHAWLVKTGFSSGLSTADRIASSDISDDWLPEDTARVGVSKNERHLDHLSKDLGDSEVLGISVVGLYDFSSANKGNITLTVSHAGEEVWQSKSVKAATALRSLAKRWAQLSWQEGMIAGLRINVLHGVDRAMQRTLAELPSASREKLISDYEHLLDGHELSRILSIANVPPIAIVKEGKTGWVLTDDGCVSSDFASLLSPLEELGDLLAGALDSVDHRVDSDAVTAWRNRFKYSSREIIHLVTKLSSDELDLIEDSAGQDIWPSYLSDPSSNEILAAARMSASLAPEEIARIISTVSAQPKRQTPRLDELSEGIQEHFSTSDYRYAWEHGLEVAQWVREQLNFPPNATIDPQQILTDLGVKVGEAVLSDSIDALATWGPEHGPAVLINASLKKRKFSPRRRVTLAHELGHLLLDREGALPVVDVLSGESSGTVEPRARAFAVELLLPQRIAFDAIAKDPESAREVVQRLMKRFGVGAEVAAWQVRNFGAELSPKALSDLRTMVSKPWLF